MYVKTLYLAKSAVWLNSKSKCMKTHDVFLHNNWRRVHFCSPALSIPSSASVCNYPTYLSSMSECPVPLQAKQNWPNPHLFDECTTHGISFATIPVRYTALILMLRWMCFKRRESSKDDTNSVFLFWLVPSYPLRLFHFWFDTWVSIFIDCYNHWGGIHYRSKTFIRMNRRGIRNCKYR